MRPFPYLISPSEFRRRLFRMKYKRAGLRPEQLQLENGSVHCWVGGDGPPLFLLQGFGTSALWQWHRQVRVLARSHTLYVPDLLYFGDSYSEEGEPSLDYQASTMFQLMDHYGVECFDLVGLSYGGFVACWMCTERPERVRRLVINGSPGLGLASTDYQTMLDTLGIVEGADLFVPDEPAGVQRLIEAAMHKPPKIPSFALEDAYNQLFLAHREERSALFNELLCHLDQPELADRAAKRIRHETLIIWGEHDRVFPLELGRRLLQRIGSNARLVVVPGTAHVPNLESPAKFNRLLLDFLAERGEE